MSIMCDCCDSRGAELAAEPVRSRAALESSDADLEDCVADIPPEPSATLAEVRYDHVADSDSSACFYAFALCSRRHVMSGSCTNTSNIYSNEFLLWRSKLMTNSQLIRKFPSMPETSSALCNMRVSLKGTCSG